LAVVDYHGYLLVGERVAFISNELKLPCVFLIALLAVKDDDMLQYVLVVDILLAFMQAVLQYVELLIELRHPTHKFLPIFHNFIDNFVLHFDQAFLKLFNQDASMF
jgi:hypothetical protein